MCRTKLFSSVDIMVHDQGIGQNSFSWNKRETLTNQVCTSYFIAEKMQWMSETDAVEGKLFCPKCKGRVGSYCWSGAQCSCGAWLTPSLQVVKTRVDEKVLK